MEFKGTKGKWVVSESHITVNDEEGYGIAQKNGITNSEQWKANALLISKAPEMLEMLQRCKEVFESLHQPFISSDIEQLIKEATEI